MRATIQEEPNPRYIGGQGSDERCPKCGRKMITCYRYRKIEGSSLGRWERIGWACEECRAFRFAEHGDGKA